MALITTIAVGQVWSRGVENNSLLIVFLVLSNTMI